MIKVLCAGDSITFGYLLNTNYSLILQDLLGGNYQVMNTSMVGITAYDYKNMEIYKQGLHFNPDIVILMFGSNDSNLDYYIAADYFKQYYSSLIDSYKARVILCTPTYAFEENYGVNKHNLKQIVKSIFEIGKEKHLDVIDFYSMSQSHPEWFDMDGVHPNVDGQRQMALRIYETI